MYKKLLFLNFSCGCNIVDIRIYKEKKNLSGLVFPLQSDSVCNCKVYLSWPLFLCVRYAFCFKPGIFTQPTGAGS